MSRKTVTTDEDAFAALKEHKRDGEPWGDVFRRAAEALDGDTDEHSLNTDDLVTPSDLDDFRVQLRRDLADEVENRLTRR